MHDCDKEIRKFHNEKVTLLKADQDQMREHRNANRDRLKRGLEKNGDPAPDKFVIQGSYAMKTMVQHPDNDYDIDDGVVFLRDDLKGKKGADKSALEARQMVCDALQDDKFNTPPKVLKNCVRVFYNEGYHIDVPVYRKEVDQEDTCYELASADWKKSNPEGVVQWFNDCLKRRKIFDVTENQLRRLVRLLKAFSKSRTGWNMPSGFILTVLSDEQYRLADARDDQPLYNLFRDVKARLDGNLVVNHPVLIGETITKTDADADMVTLRDKLDWALKELDILFGPLCTHKAALKAWGRVFNTDYFDQFIEDDSNQKASVAIAINKPTVAVDKRGGGQYA